MGSSSSRSNGYLAGYAQCHADRSLRAQRAATLWHSREMDSWYARLRVG